MRLVAVIPARMAATRCPGKPLIELAGKPMIRWVFEAVARAEKPDLAVVATPDEVIAEAVKAFGGRAVLTDVDHPTGTDRVAEVARLIQADAYMNVQGDEPLMPPQTVDACAELILAGADVASVYDWATPDEANDPAVVKVVTDLSDRALYFSRSPIPFVRGVQAQRVKKHVGIYGYSRKALLSFADWGPSPLEGTEMLEQLRFLEHGVPIQMRNAKGAPLAVDTPDQAEAAAAILAGGES